MFRQKLWYAVELSSLSKSSLLRSRINRVSFGLIQPQRAIQNSRWKILPDSIEHLLFQPDPRPFNQGLLKPLLFSVGFSTVSFISCALWERRNKSSRKIYMKESKPGWNSRDGSKVFYTILFLNVLVFGAWRVQALVPYMIEYFLSSPTSRSSIVSMVLSTFSHFSFLHLFMNMYVLDMFMPNAINSLGKEQFVGMYLSGAVFSNFISFAYKIWKDDTGLSLGASGAIMSVISYVCFKHPDVKLSIVFLPSFQFTAASAIKFMMLTDVLGVVLGSKAFDHAGHLGGALFGIFWCWFGSKYLWGNRDKMFRS